MGENQAVKPTRRRNQGGGNRTGAAGPVGPQGTDSVNVGPTLTYTGVAIPVTLLRTLGIDPSKLPSTLKFQPTGGLAHNPSTGKELWQAIQQLTTNPEYAGFNKANLQKLQKALKTAYFPAGFSGTGADASKVFGAVSTILTSNFYSLNGLVPPTTKQIYGNQVAETLQTLQSQNDNLTAAVNNATAAQQANAFSTIQNYLYQWGLSDLTPDFYNIVTKDGDHIINTDALLNIMRGVGTTGNKAEDKRLQSAYDARFAGLNEYNKNDANTVKMTESAYQQYTAAIKDTATQYGAPVPSQNQIGELLNHNVSAPEFQARVRDISNAIQSSDQSVRNILEQKYGVTQAGLWDYMTTGSLPERQREIATAQTQDYAQRVGLRGLTDKNFNELGEMARIGAGANPLGYGVGQIQSALLNASRDVALTQAQPGQSAPTVTTQQLIGSQLAGFAGTSQPAEQLQVVRAEQAKAQPFEKGGGYAENQKGVTGLGSART